MRYIRDNNNLRRKYHSDINNAPVSDLMRQDIVNNENQLMDLSDSSW